MSRLEFRTARLEKANRFQLVRNVFSEDEHEAIAAAIAQGIPYAVMPQKCATTEEWLAQCRKTR